MFQLGEEVMLSRPRGLKWRELPMTWVLLCTSVCTRACWKPITPLGRKGNTVESHPAFHKQKYLQMQRGLLQKSWGEGVQGQRRHQLFRSRGSPVGVVAAVWESDSHGRLLIICVKLAAGRWWQDQNQTRRSDESREKWGFREQMLDSSHGQRLWSSCLCPHPAIREVHNLQLCFPKSHYKNPMEFSNNDDFNKRIKW